MRFWPIIPALALVACGKDPESTPDDDRIGLIIASFCEETSREALTDGSVAPEGFTTTPDEAVAALAGAFVGKLTTYDDLGAEASEVGISVDLQVSGIEAVRYTRHAFDVDGAEIDTGEACRGAYEMTGTAAIETDDGALDESFALAMHVEDGAYGVFSVDIPLASVGGTARPSSFDPAEWDTTSLHVEGSGEANAWVGSSWWMASNDVEDDTDTGTIEPSGTSETVGTFTIGRP